MISPKRKLRKPVIICGVMFSMLRRVFRPNAQNRRVMSGLCAAFILTTIAVSSIFVTAEADHDCVGRDCPICIELQNCVTNFQLVGSSAAPCGGSLPARTLSTVETFPCVLRTPATTLHALNVRFDE